jgi:glycosyltransferase involved in cell wall biosynthesis
VLASNTTSLPEIAGDAALLVNPRSVPEIARGLVQITSDQQFRAHLIEQGMHRAARYSWDATGSAIRVILGSVQ